jgi:thiaminase/transcriptional activator TenA
VAQDAFFLLAFTRAYALATARCRRLEDVEAFHRLLGGALEELKLHRSYARELGIQLETVEPYQETKAYTDFLGASAWHGHRGEMLAAMTPCMRLYAFLGTELAGAGLPANRHYRAWIETYSARDFADLAATLEELLDRHAEDSKSVREAYRYALRCEFDFFSAPYRGEAPGGAR